MTRQYPLDVLLVDSRAGPAPQSGWVVQSMVIETAAWFALPDPHGRMHVFVGALAWDVGGLACRGICLPVLARCAGATVGEQELWSEGLVDLAWS